MPYSGPDDETLPANVQKLPAALKKQWIAVFNDSFDNCKNPKIGGGAGKDCETVAFRMANGVIKKRAKEIGVMFDSEEDTKEGRMLSAANAGKIKAALETLMGLLKSAGLVDEPTKEAGEKQCIDCGTVVEYRAYGGATTFEEVDAFMEAQDKSAQIEDQTYIFREVMRNIMDDPDLDFDQKATAIQKAAQELPARVANPPKPPWRKETEEKMGRRQFFGRIGEVLGLKPASKEKGSKAAPVAGGGNQVGSAFALTKDVSGRLRYISVTSNRYYDRDGEVFPEAVHKEAIAYADRKEEYPELWLWHTPGTRFGKGDMVDYFDGFRVDSGLIDKGMESVAIKIASLPDLGVSHGFSFVKQADTYTEYRDNEVSVLPRERAANPWTGMILESEDKSMGFTDKKREFLVGALGDERVIQIEQAVGLLKESAETAGVAFKELLPEDVKEEVEATAGVEKLLGDLTTAVSGVATQVTALTEKVSGIETTVAGQAAEIKALKEDDDAKIARGLQTRAAALNPSESPATKDSNVITEEEARKAGAGDSPPSASAPFVKQAEKVLGIAEA